MAHRDGTPSGGRPKGAVNWHTRYIQAFCRSIVESEEYQKTVMDRARTGTLGPMEPIILSYGYGPPKQTIELQVGLAQEDLSLLSLEELAQRAADLMHQLKEARELEKVLPPHYIDVNPSEVFDVAPCETESQVPDDDSGRRDALQDLPQGLHEHGLRVVADAASIGVTEEGEEDKSCDD